MRGGRQDVKPPCLLFLELFRPRSSVLLFGTPTVGANLDNVEGSPGLRGNCEPRGAEPGDRVTAHWAVHLWCEVGRAAGPSPVMVLKQEFPKWGRSKAVLSSGGRVPGPVFQAESV